MRSPRLKHLAILVAALLLAGAPASMRQGLAAPVSAGEAAAVEAAFRTWLDGLWPRARAAGISRQTFDSAFADVSLDWNLPDLSPPGRETRPETLRQQPEFSSPGRYFNQDALENLVARGRAALAKWAGALAQIERRYEVPRGIVLAIWARETGYGRVAPPHDAIRALATQAFMGRRKQQFLDELLLALRILQEGHISRAAMKSSWAGAMGLPQFLPSDFYASAVDFDGDGARDIWTSVPDALASIANTLKRNGWRADTSWGYEVEIPAALACTLEGPHQGRAIGEWIALGARRTFGRAFSERLKRETGYLLLPAGRHGPAFIVTDNFYVLKKYNESDVYALFVGHLADRYANNRRFAGAWKGVETFRRDHVRDMQQRLVGRGLDVGSVDGLIGFKTRVATGIFEHSQGLTPKCYPTPEIMEMVRTDSLK